ncbi:hypothetical protein D3C81_1895190 [compost metagenome]
MAWKLVKKIVHQHRIALRLANRCMGNNGSRARRSWTTNSPSTSTAQASSASTSALRHEWPWPTWVMPSNNAVSPMIISTVPR